MHAFCCPAGYCSDQATSKLDPCVPRDVILCKQDVIGKEGKGVILVLDDDEDDLCVCFFHVNVLPSSRLVIQYHKSC